jgi:hypothetical protein
MYVLATVWCASVFCAGANAPMSLYWFMTCYQLADPYQSVFTVVDMTALGVRQR